MVINQISSRWRQALVRVAGILVGVLVLNCIQLVQSVQPAQAMTDCENDFKCNRDDASYAECLQKKQACLQTNIQESQSSATTLKGAIAVLNGQIDLQQLQIDQTLAEIDKLEQEIGALNGAISNLSVSLDNLTKLLIARARAQYKQNRLNVSPLSTFLTHSVNESLSQLQYLAYTQQQSIRAMQLTESQRLLFDEQKQLKEKKQAEVAKKKALLERQRADLTRKRAAQQNLLKETQNNEKRYQQLLAQAQAELAALRNFSSSKGGGVVSAQTSPDGWYFSQRDERWGNVCIGNSCGTANSATLMQVGCLISDVAMIKKKYGEDVTPLSIGTNPAYFSLNTAYMKSPWPAPSGHSYQRFYGYNQATIDQEMTAGRPVIVHLRFGTADGHFIVLKNGANGHYVMHDPWEGYDKTFTDFYSTLQIVDFSVLR